MVSTRTTRVLLAVDVQSSFFKEDTLIPFATQLLSNIQSIVDRARAAEPPVQVIWVRHGDPNDPDFTPNTPSWEISLKPNRDEIIVDKTKSSAFIDTQLASHLPSSSDSEKNLELTLIGLQSEFCIQATTKSALELYPNATTRVVRGAHGTYNSENKTSCQISEEIDNELANAGAQIVEWEDLGY